MAYHEPTRQDDIQLLRMLDMRDGEGMTSTLIAEATGRTRSSVMGAMHRVDTAELPCACKKKKNQDGGMKRGWWK